MSYFLSNIKRLDWKIVLSVFVLSIIGLVSIYSISIGKEDFSSFKKQIMFLTIGFLMMFVISFLDWRGFKDNSYFVLFIYIICIVFLAGLFVFSPEIRGVKRWYRIGGFSFDPIGITSIALIIILAKFFSKRHVEMYKLGHIVLSGIYFLIPFVLISSQPNLGSALMLGIIWIGVLIVSGIKIKHFLILSLIAIIVFTLSWSLFLRDYQKKRIVSFLSPQTETLGINWSQTQSKIAIGSGGFLGQGFGSGSQTQHGFLSEPYTDFIFSAYAEEFGLVGIFIMLFFFLFLFWRIVRISFLAKSNFPRLFAMGLAIFIFSQALIHIAMNIGFLPVIGLPLPFVSYGGSNLIAIFIGLGILQSININS